MHPQKPQSVQGKPELLAPAGKAESFITALAAGANAVYCGLKRFNARLRAENFSLADLSRLIPYAHERGKKVYVTLNTLLKQRELPEALEMVFALQRLKADALIVADPGLIGIVARRFPDLKLHASTQMGIHNSAGCAAAGRLGIRRVILARELSLPELALVRRHTDLELEVFVHGALCYSFSGSCLASSFIGGKSGNRGLCTQVCRRAFQSGKDRAPFFSPYDLQALPLVPQLAGLGINSFKIEGRLKSGSSIAAVVSVYRRAIDRPESVPDLLSEIEEDFGRKKTLFFLGKPDEKILQEAAETTATGVPVGTVLAVTEHGVITALSRAVRPGDLVRIQPQSGYEGQRHKISAAREEGGKTDLAFYTPPDCAPGDKIFLVGRKTAPMPGLPPALRPPAKASLAFPEAASLVQRFAQNKRRQPEARSVFSILIDSLEWLPLVSGTGAEEIILACENRPLQALPAALKKAGGVPTRLAVGLPRFIPEPEIGAAGKAVRALRELGVRRFFINSPSALLPDLAGATLTADRGLACLNTPARAAVGSLGISRFCYPLEDDFLNMRNARDFTGMVTLYGLVPLFVSRIRPGLPPGTALLDQEGGGFFTARRDDLYFLVGTVPVCLFARREKLETLGIRRFLIDLSFQEKNRELLACVLAAYREKRRILPSTMFNFKRELA